MAEGCDILNNIVVNGRAECTGQAHRQELSPFMINIGVVTISDRASNGVYEDLSGKVIIDTLGAYLVSTWNLEYRVIPDEQDLIEQTLIELVDVRGCCLVVTTGGTGPALRDVTPEATAAVCSKMLPGFGEMMRAESLKYVPTAILSRQTAGIRGSGPNCQFARQTQCHYSVSPSGVSGNTLLHRPDQRTISAGEP